MMKGNGIRRCRLCACEEDFQSFSNIFDDHPEMALEMKITKLLPVVVMPWDPMPHTVCHNCIKKLNFFNDFYETSLKAERFLRTLYPGAPESELEGLNPVVKIMDPPVLSKSSLKLPLKKRQGIPPISPPTNKNSSTEFNDVPQIPLNNQEKTYPKRTSKRFIINQISSRDSVYTCRECFRTFTKQSSALTHSCVRIEDCAEIETIDLDEEDAKSLPPLKIRLFSMRSGMFICYICKTSFEEKKHMIEHIRRHIEEGGGKIEKQKEKKKGRHVDKPDEDEVLEEAYKKRAGKKKKKCSGPPKKRGKLKCEDTVKECGSCETCGKSRNSLNPTPKETVEQTTQCSEISDNSGAQKPKEDEQQKKKEETLVTINHPFCLDQVNDVMAVETIQTNVPSSFLANELIISKPDNDQLLDIEDVSDEVTILEVINNKTPTALSSGVFCEKTLAAKDTLISHQNNQTKGISELKFELIKRVANPEEESGEKETYLCSVCAMLFKNKKALLEHEQYHVFDIDAAGCQKSIRIALAHEFASRDVEQKCQISKGREIITITVTAGENNSSRLN